MKKMPNHDFLLCVVQGADTRGGLGGPDLPFYTVVGVSRPCILPGGLRSFYRAQAAPRIPRFSLVYIDLDLASRRRRGSARLVYSLNLRALTLRTRVRACEHVYECA